MDRDDERLRHEGNTGNKPGVGGWGLELRVYICLYISIAYMHIFVTHIHTHIYTYMCIFIHIYMHMYMYIYIYIHTYICICMYLCKRFCGWGSSDDERLRHEGDPCDQPRGGVGV